MNFYRKLRIFNLVLFLFWPFGSFLLTVIDRRIYSSIIIILFFFLYGYAVYSPGGGSDLEVYRSSFNQIRTNSSITYYSLLKETYTTAEQPDLYGISLQYFVSRFTSDYRVFMGVASVIQFYFLLMIVIKLKKIIETNRKFSYLLLAIFILLIPFQSFTGIRYWTGFYVFIYGAICYFESAKLKYWAWILITPFIHFAFVVPVILFILHGFLRKKIIIISVLIPLAFFLKLSVLTYIGEQKFSESENLQSRQSNYLSVDEYESRKQSFQNSNFYLYINSVGIYLTFIGIISIVLYQTRGKFESPYLSNLFSFVLLMMVLAILTKNMGSLSRYSRFFEGFSIIFTIYYLQAGYKLFAQRITYRLLVVLGVIVLYVSFLRGALMFTDPNLVLNNLVAIVKTQSDQNMSDLLFSWLQ